MLRSILAYSLLLIACGSEVSTTPTVDGGTDASSEAGGKSCLDGTTTHAHGTSWKCSDGCNSCNCNDGLVNSTTIACGCSDKTGFHIAGASWTCPDGCNTCTCNKDLTISSTLKDCAPLADAATD